ncbi:MAG: extracellular solute-binding protein [Lachnospiraceae bacterium]|nr:extracellular solute-binding protein [Lachnospiraceae bacterium]
MRIKKYAAAFLAATTVLGSLAACGDSQTGADPTQAPATEAPKPTEEAKPTEGPKATPIPDRDLGGMEIIIGDHWSPETPAEPTNAQEEATAKYREEIFAKYNFRMQSKTVAGWGEMTDTCVNSITAGEPAAQLFELDYRFVAKPMANGLFYDLATLDELDFSEDKWSVAVKNLMTKGNSIYGMRAQKAEPRGGVVWNKRLFEEAGLDPDLPYDLQASGEWTWSKFEELCAKLTRDTNADGVTDIYATVSQGAATMTILVASSGADYFAKDANGNLVNNMGSKEVLDAINFAVDLYNKGYEMPQPADSQWDYFIPAFQEGKAAMQFNEEYVLQPTNIYGDDMEDVCGFVMPPKPDGAASYHSYVCDNITIIPSCYDAETAGNIAFAYNVYTMATPGYDDPDAWKEMYYNHFEEERGVDETIVMFNDGVSTHFLAQTLVPQDLGPDLLWQYPFANVTPADQVAAIKDSWDAILAEVNQ